MTYGFPQLTTLAFAISIGYLIGALPIADRISRRYGVDIFSTGTRLAGASNVRRNVGTGPAIMVLIGDISKGMLTVLAAKLVGLQDSWLILPSAAAIIGHWRSVFSGFRGGDGNAILGGILIGLFPTYALAALLGGSIVGLGAKKLGYSSLVHIAAGYMILVALAVTTNGNLTLVLGFGGLASMVLAYALYGHIRRRRTSSGDIWDDDLVDPDASQEQPNFKP